MLGKRMAEGFSWYRPMMSVGGSYDYLYAHNGSPVPPPGVLFRNCPANWTYFKVVGLNREFRPSDAHEYTNIYARVRYFGAERNPDSIRVEFSGDLFRNYYGSFQKTTFCNSCVATDRTSPVIHKCPTQTLTSPWTSTVLGEGAFNAAGLSISDNCGVETAEILPFITRNVQPGQTIDYKTVAYDEYGNAAVCKFKVKYVQATAASYATLDTLTAKILESVPMIMNGLSPNPTDGALQVALTSTVAQSVDFDIYNTYGQRVHSVVQSVSVGENQLFFDLTKLPTGTYFIQTRDQAVHANKHTFVKY
jgi:hypothetical protein